MKYLNNVFFFSFLAVMISCGGKNEPDVSAKKESNTTKTLRSDQDSLNSESKNDTIILQPTLKNKNNNRPNSDLNNQKNPTTINTDTKEDNIITSPAAKKAEAVINSPLRNLLNNAQIGKSYSKKELIENYKFPKEAVDLIKHVTCIGPNKLYFNWGSTWFVEKVSDAKFKNDTLIFTFKQNKTYVSGGAIGIKYNKKIYTDLILNNGLAYIPSVKGYHWEINK